MNVMKCICRIAKPKLICHESSSHINRNKSLEIAYTDGSFRPKDDYLGFGVWYNDNNKNNKSYRLTGGYDSNRAELAGIYAAVVSSTDDKTLMVNTDSAVGMNMIYQYFYNDKSFGKFDPLLRGIRQLVQIRVYPTILFKVKSHANIEGNIKADHLAKTAPPNIYFILPDNTVLDILQQHEIGNTVIFPKKHLISKVYNNDDMFLEI